MFRLNTFKKKKKAIFSAQGICFCTHAVWRTKLCSAVKRKCEWERFWDVDKEEGREMVVVVVVVRGGFNFAVSQPPL